jgi:hypothetical protein
MLQLARIEEDRHDLCRSKERREAREMERWVCVQLEFR